MNMATRNASTDSREKPSNVEHSSIPKPPPVVTLSSTMTLLSSRLAISTITPGSRCHRTSPGRPSRRTCPTLIRWFGKRSRLNMLRRHPTTNSSGRRGSWQTKGTTHIPTCDQGLLRARRIVAKHVKRSLHPPPLEPLKVLFSDVAPGRWHSDEKPLQTSYMDIRKACLNATPTRNLCLPFPGELCVPNGYCGHTLRCVDGTRVRGVLGNAATAIVYWTLALREAGHHRVAFSMNNMAYDW